MVQVSEKGVLSDKVRKLKESLLEIKPRLLTERLRFLMEAYRETEGEPPIVTRARVFSKTLRGMTIFIDENPIVGTLTQYRAGIQPYPEVGCHWMRREITGGYSTALGKGVLSEGDKELMEEAVDYWWDRCLLAKTQKEFAEKYGQGIRNDMAIKVIVWGDNVGHPLIASRFCPGFGKVLNKGLNGVIEEARTELRNLPLGSLEASEKREFLNSVVEACQAVIDFAHRYADLAQDIAQSEANPDRKAELERIAETCNWVPANPARNFCEAIQSVWFTHLCVMIESCSDGHALGRFTRYMYPFYRKDKEEGRITDEEVIELLELLFIKLTEIDIYIPRRDFESNMGSLFQNLALGGVTPDGRDATNELDYLVLEAQKRVRMIQPTLSILYHDRMSEEFVLKALEVVRTGLGMPAFFSSDLNIERLLEHGASLEDARNHCIIGCVESGFSHSAGTMMGGFINMPKLLELALHNGKDPRTGIQIGPQTGEAESFQSYDELHHALRKQLEYFLPFYHDFEFTGHALNARLLPAPFSSALIDDCIKKGKDMNSGGARYSQDGGGPVGTVDLADSLAAIKKLVFEDKKITMKELLEALQVNFEGKEDLRYMLLNAPKYGNDDNYVDEIAREWYDIFYEEHQRFKNHLGHTLKPWALSITTQFPFGAVVGALPSGREAGVSLADGTVSASPGMDKNGPTALIKSAAKAIDTIKYASALLNTKFHPTVLKDREGMRKLLALIKTYLDLGGHHVQFNVVSGETLRDAQLHPENYRDLIVRVAGFSAYFIHLDPGVQEQIIKRTELTV